MYYNKFGRKKNKDGDLMSKAQVNKVTNYLKGYSEHI